MRKRLFGSCAKTTLAVITALSLGLAGCGSSGGGSDSGTVGAARSVAVSNRAFTGTEGASCPNGGRAIDVWLDKDGNGTMGAGELLSTEIICNGTNGTNGTDGTNGTNGTNGVAGADGKTALIKVSTETNGANCKSGGQKIEVGLDDINVNMVLDALEVDQTTYVCNGENAGSNYTAKGEACPICHGAGRSEDEVAAHQLPAIHNRGVALLGRTELANITVAPTLNAGALQSLTITFDAKTYDANNIQIDNTLLTAAATTATNLANLRFYLAKYDPDTRGWKRVVNGSVVKAGLVNNNGTTLANATNYTYTFAAADLTAINVTDPATVGPFGFTTDGMYRAYIRASLSNYYGPSSSTKDFTMNGSALVDRQIVTTAACEGCHGQIPNHGVGRPDAQACVICHNGPAAMSLVNGEYVYDTAKPFSGTIAYDSFIHELHANFGFKTHFAAGEMTYPQDLKNCKTCHKGTAGAAAYNSYKVSACRGCHQDNVVFTDPTNTTYHGDFTDSAADSAGCATFCHKTGGFAKPIAVAHATMLASPNSIGQVAGFSKIEYAITSAAVDASGNLTIVFSIKKDGVLLDLTAGNPTNFTGGPSFLLAYALPQDGIATPADYNNLGKAAAQPASVSLANMVKNSITTPLAGWSLTNNAGVATAVVPAASAFPANATLRAVGLQGYWTDGRGTTATTDDIPLHTPAVAKSVTGDAVRRQVVDPNKCGACHEWFEGHGGNRVFETQVCAMCHVPNLTSSGRTTTVGMPVDTAGGVVAGITVGTDGKASAVDTAAIPEAPQSLKTLIHGVHSSELRQDPFEFVRVRSVTGVGPTAFEFDMSEVKFPGILKKCTTCHIDGTFGIGQANLLNTTFVTTPGGIPTAAQVAASRNTVPNATDLVATPVYSTCALCHDGAMQETHFNGNGGGVAPRSEINK